VDAVAACKFSEVIILAVKPRDLLELATSIASTLNPNQVVISAASGIVLERIRTALGGHLRLSRVMPNLAASINSAVTGVYSDDPLAKSTTLTLFKDLGTCIECDNDNEIDQLTGLAASGPGFVAEFLDGLQSAAAELGIKNSKEIVLQMAMGTLQVLASGKEGMSEFVSRVKTPGGTTAAGIACFEEYSMRKMLKEGLAASIKRAGAINQEIE